MINLTRPSALILTATVVCDRCQTVICSASAPVDGKDTLAVNGLAVGEHGSRYYREEAARRIECRECAAAMVVRAAGQVEMFGATV